MKGDCKTYRSQDVRDRCGLLKLTAENDTDAALLAMIYRALFKVLAVPAARFQLYEALLPMMKGFEEPQAMVDYKSAKKEALESNDPQMNADFYVF